MKSARQIYDLRLRELGGITLGRIEIAPFVVERFGTTFGLIPLPPEEEREGWRVEVQPGDSMAFSKAWGQRLL